jgi:hypothetical protein
MQMLADSIQCAISTVNDLKVDEAPRASPNERNGPEWWVYAKVTGRTVVLPDAMQCKILTEMMEVVPLMKR